MFDDELERYTREERSEQDQERAIQLNALCRVYEQADRVITGDPVLVHVMKDGPAPAWSDGAAIYINVKEINDMDLESLAQVNGLNFHELAHHLYTPRRGTVFMKWVVDNDLMRAANMLEDQRIETLLVGRYPSVAPFLTATVARWLASTPEEAIGNYMLVRGRRYLPLEMREAFRDLFAQPELIPAIADIVDQYRVLAFPRDYAKGQELIQRFNDEVLANIDFDAPHGPNGCSEREPVVKGRPDPGKAQERDAKRAGGQGVAESTNTNKPKQQAANAPTTKEEALDMANENARNKANNDTEAGPKPVAGEGHHASLGGIPDSVKDMLNDVIDDVLARKDVQADIKTKQKVIIGGDGKHNDSVRRGKFDTTPVPDNSMAIYRKFARELERLRDECEPAWHKEEASGRLNVQRVIRGCEIDEAFDRWDEGTDGSDIEAVILVDRSGSMSGGNDREASIACWTIKRAVEQVGGLVTVYAFDDEAEVAYRREDKADRTKYKFIYGNGGTDPYNTLLAAEQLLMSSRKKNKMLFIVTDGVFDDSRNNPIINRISKRGILTAMTLIMSDRDMEYYKSRHDFDEEEFRHGAEIFGRVKNASDLLPFAKSVVTGAIRKRGR
jgi:hypothetical protein